MDTKNEIFKRQAEQWGRMQRSLLEPSVQRWELHVSENILSSKKGKGKQIREKACSSLVQSRRLRKNN